MKPGVTLVKFSLLSLGRKVHETISLNFCLTVRDVDTVEDMADSPPNASPEQEENAIEITFNNFQSEDVSLKNYICNI